MQPVRKFKFNGFTLIEIILVIALIGILAGLFMANVFSSLARGRDSRRKQDLRAVAQALELYYNDNNRYPDDLPAGNESFTHPNDPGSIYLQKTPVDPSTKIRYCYETEDGSSYRITTNLENNSDAEIFTVLTNCGGNEFNYGISSSNINL